MLVINNLFLRFDPQGPDQLVNVSCSMPMGRIITFIGKVGQEKRRYCAASRMCRRGIGAP